MWLIFAMYALCASTFTVGKEVLTIVPPIYLNAVRMLLAGVLLLSFVAFDKKRSLYIRKSHWWIVLMIGVLQFYLSFVLEFSGLAYLTSSKTALLYNLSPFITALLSYIFYSEIMSFKKWIGLLIGFLGFIPLLLSQTPAAEQALGSFGYFSWPELYLIASVVVSCGAWIMMRHATRGHNYCYFLVNGLAMLIGGLLSLVTSFYLETVPPVSMFGNALFIRSLIYLIIVGNVLFFNIYGKLLHTYSATVLSFFGFSTPLFAALFSWFWLDETVSYEFFATALLVSVGLYVFYQEELKLGYIIEN